MRAAAWSANLLVPALMAGAGLGCERARPPDALGGPAREPVTFNKHIAPIVLRDCAPCHRPGEAGPFSLLSYDDVREHAADVARVTATRYMPPWPPEPGYGEFAGERRLTDEQVALIQRWAREGTPQGAASDLPPPPRFAQGWQLGEPDLVLEVDEPYTVPAEGTDVFRNFVVPSTVTGPRHVKALELRPGEKTIVHHANVLLDRTGSARRQDADAPGPGFGGMDVELESDRFEPDSHFLFWKPGTAAVSEPEGMAWRLDPDTDLVLNMHLQPSGKPEAIRPVVGLYFGDAPPTRHPMLLQLEHDGAIDIPAGEKAFVVSDHYVLPVDVELLAIYPHAHYLGKDVQAFASLPDGTRKWLVWIKDWDFDWQAVYRYARPVPLPAGTTVHMRITYDNSSDNVRNPSQPPRRVRAGNRSTDEMGHVWIQVLPRAADDRRVLQETSMRRRLEKYPGDFVAHANLGAVLEDRGRPEEAIAHYQEALRARPGSAAMLNNLGAVLQSTGRNDESLRRYRQAVRAQPYYASARYNLGNALAARGAFAEAIAHFREVVRARPDDVAALGNLGAALLATGEVEGAVRQLTRVLSSDPENLNAHYNLGRALALRGDLRGAAAHFEQAVRIDPHDAPSATGLRETRELLRRAN